MKLNHRLKDLEKRIEQAERAAPECQPPRLLILKAMIELGNLLNDPRYLSGEAVTDEIYEASAIEFERLKRELSDDDLAALIVRYRTREAEGFAKLKAARPNWYGLRPAPVRRIEPVDLGTRMDRREL
jgi:hypothetical protein